MDKQKHKEACQVMLLMKDANRLTEDVSQIKKNGSFVTDYDAPGVLQWTPDFKSLGNDTLYTVQGDFAAKLCEETEKFKDRMLQILSEYKSDLDKKFFDL